MLRGIIAFEWRLATGRITFWAAALLLGALGVVLAKTGFGARDIPVNAPYPVAYGIAFLGLTSVFVVTVLVAPSLLRDGEHRMTELIFSTAVTRRDHLLGRFTGAYLATVAVFALGVLGMVAGALLQGPDAAGPFRPAAYLLPFAILALPTLFFLSALLFAVSAITRSALATYLAGVLVYVLYLVAAVLTDSPFLASSGPVSARALAFGALVDPFGLTAFFDQTHYWTAPERAVRPLSLGGRLLTNRLLWTGAGVALLCLSARIFSFRVETRRRRPAEPVRVAVPATRPASVPAPVAPSTLAAIASTLRMELRLTVRGWPFLVLLLLWGAVAGIELNENLRRVEFGTALLPTTPLILRTLEQPLSLFGLLLLVYFTAELLWRERTAGIAELVDASPSPNVVFLVGKLGALWVLIAMLVVVGAGVGLVFQLLLGHREYHLELYAASLLLSGAPLALFAVLAVGLQVVAPNRHAGMLATLAAAIVFPLGATPAPEHPLLRFAVLGGVPVSELAGFSPALGTFLALGAHWTAVSIVLVILTAGLWRRGTLTGLTERFRRVRHGWRPGHTLLLGASVTVTAALAAVLAYQLHVVNGYAGTDARRRWRADYERTYGMLRGQPLPALEHLEATLAVQPEERRYRVQGRARLRNTTPTTLQTVWLTVRDGVRVGTLTLAGQPAAAHDPRFGTYRFDRPLEPGATVSLEFDLTVHHRGFTEAPEDDVLPEGSLISLDAVLPSLGYRAGYELDDARDRRREGLPAKVQAPGGPLPFITYAVDVLGPADQRVAGPGIERGSRIVAGRKLTRFETVAPLPASLAFALARYQVARAERDGVTIEVLHHPGHTLNVARMLEAAADALSLFQRSYGRYPLPALRIAEVPSFSERFAGFALPGLIVLAEDRAFLTDTRDASRTDLVTKRVAHEVSHMWWGRQVVPAPGPGASAIVETLARYAELRVLRAKHGAAAIPPVLRVERDKYLAGRARDPEVPLDQVTEDQPHLYYAKGALVMMGLEARIGEAQVTSGLRAFFAEAMGSTRPPGVEDLIRHLRAATPPLHHAFLEQAWSQIVLEDLSVLSAVATRTSGGGYRVEAQLRARQVRYDGDAREETAGRGTVTVAVYGVFPETEGATPLATTDVTLGKDGASVSFDLDEAPAYLVVDPELTRIDANPADNLRAIELPARLDTGAGALVIAGGDRAPR